jgi:hypothetical protein
MKTTASLRYQLFSLDSNLKRTLLGAFRFYTDAYIALRSCEDSDPIGNYWINDSGDMPYPC